MRPLIAVLQRVLERKGIPSCPVSPTRRPLVMAPGSSAISAKIINGRYIYCRFWVKLPGRFSPHRNPVARIPYERRRHG
jgi:hypothetical protein